MCTTSSPVLLIASFSLSYTHQPSSQSQVCSTLVQPTDPRHNHQVPLPRGSHDFSPYMSKPQSQEAHPPILAHDEPLSHLSQAAVPCRRLSPPQPKLRSHAGCSLPPQPKLRSLATGPGHSWDHHRHVNCLFTWRPSTAMCFLGHL